jgi:hypothetical protein
MLQIGRIFKFAKGFDDVGRHLLAHSAKEKALTKLAKKGTNWGMQAFKLGLIESVQETLQEGTTIGIVKLHGEEIEFHDAINRLAMAATGAFVVAPFFASCNGGYRSLCSCSVLCLSWSGLSPLGIEC